MGAKGEAYAEQLGKTSEALRATVERISDSAWKANCESEGWTAAATAHHAASSIEVVSGLIQAVASGGQLPPFGQDMIDGMNAKHASDFAGCSKQETLDALVKGTAIAQQMLRSLPDEAMDRTANFVGQEMPVSAMIEHILIEHTADHGASVAAVAAAPA